MEDSLKTNAEFLRTLLAYIKSTYLPEKRHNPKYPDTFSSGDLHFFAPAVADLSALFTFDRSARRENYFNTKEARSSYLLYFLIPNMLKVQWILEQQKLAEVFANEPEVRIADIGCGPCTGLLAALQHWQTNAPQQKLKCLGVDQNGASLKDGAALFNRVIARSPKGDVAIPAEHSGLLRPTSVARNDSNATLTTRTASLSQLRKALGSARFHILIVANVLNELANTEDRYTFIRNLIAQHLTPNGSLIIIEPALQRATRDLMLLRDQLASPSPLGGEGRPSAKALASAEGEGSDPIAHVLSPCLHQALCPMRANNPRDWCHTYLNWERPQVISDLDMLIGNKKDYLKMSYMVLCHCEERSDAAIQLSSSESKVDQRDCHGLQPRNDKLYRVVSAPMKSKGKLEILFCGKNGKLLRVTRQDKDRSKFNGALDQLQRGDIVEYAGEAKCGRETIVTYAAR